MEWFRFIAEFGGVLFSLFSFGFIVVITVRHFLLKSRPTHLHVAMHFLRPQDEKLAFKFPTLQVFLLPDMFDYLTSTWLLLCAKRWSKRSAFGPILAIPASNGGSRLKRFLPERKHFLQPLLQWLSAANFEDWRDRAARAARDPKADPQEELFVVAIVYEQNSKSLRGLVVPEKVLQLLLDEPDRVSESPHENYGGAPERPATLMQLARAWQEWKLGTQPELAIGLLEL